MNPIIKVASAISITTAGFVVACGGSQHAQAVPGTGVTSAQSADSAIVDRLASARCDREQTCEKIGAGRTYASRDVCMEQMRGGLANDLNSYNCPQGINQSALEDCLTSVRNEECNHPLQTISRMDKCRTGSLCMK